MKKQWIKYFTAFIGFALLATGIVLIKTISEPQGIMRALPYILVGIGCGTFGHGIGDIIEKISYAKYPEAKKQTEIEQKDERNVSIANRAKAKAYDAMLFIFGALMISFALMNVDLIIVLTLVCAYLIVVGIGIYYRCKYDKEM